MTNAKRRARPGAGVPWRTKVDRRSARWLRLRAACVHAASDVDVAAHVDAVYRTLAARGAK